MAVNKPKFFRVATEGATSDGREIDREMIVQMAANYDPETYSARINLEHIRGYDPNGPFKAYGDVMALKAEEQDGKMRLFAQLDPTPDLVTITKARQKIFCSMEVNPAFADTGEAYLTALAVTDNPASLGCEMLQFSAKAKVNPLAERKQDPKNLFTEAVEVDLDFSTAKADHQIQATPGLAASIKRMFGRQEKSEASQADTGEAVQALAAEVKGMNDNFTKVIKAVETMADRVDELQEAQIKGQQAFSTLKDELENTETFSRRPAATGGSGSAQLETDC